jgi:hypothetical protein
MVADSNGGGGACMSFATISAQGINRVLGEGTQTNPYQIRTAKQLYDLAVCVNAGNDCADDYYIQTADIDLSAYANWIGIGTATNQFSGNYNGNGFAIYNLTMTADYAGLFGVCQSILKNINIQSGTIKGTTGINRLGGICGASNGGTISGCINKAAVNGFSTGSNTCYCAGILGIAATGTVSITDCLNLGTITHSTNTTAVTTVAAGISRKTSAATMTVSRCLNAGIVTGEGVLSGTRIREALTSAATAIANSYYDSTVSGALDTSGSTGRATADCQGTDALTNESKLNGLGTTNWFARSGDYPMPIRFNK